MSDVENYLGKLGAEDRAALERIRQLVKEVAVDSEEVMSYSMPGFKYHGKYLAGYAAFKDHLSFFPTPHLIEELKPRLAGYVLSKGTFQFSAKDLLPSDLVRDLINIRITDITDQ